MKGRIVVGEGVQDDDFWRWSSQLVRGIAAIHSNGILHLAVKSETIRLSDETGEVRISGFQNACEAEAAAAYALPPTDQPEYRAPEKACSFAADVFSVGVVLFEMATGTLPCRESDVLKIEDPAKRELISFAFHDEASKRPTADELLDKIAMLAPSSVMESEFRAQVFASLRFNDHGPMAETKLLRGIKDRFCYMEAMDVVAQ